ncbi:MAG: helical backbone metal receptor [Bacteroidia bacterium]|nr:helical backbone metal receptor [Bacteroidia bacterium]MDW8345945.1 helical backbone metal receptor [Bacteroidia bacterium]
MRVANFYYLGSALYLVFILFKSCTPSDKKNSDKSVVFIDDADQKHVFRQYPKRVVCLVPSITELLYAIGADSQIVAITEHCNYPEQAAKFSQKLVVYPNVSTEKVLSLKPDLILTSTEVMSVKIIEQFKPHQIPVFFINYRTLADIPRSIRLLGNLLGKTRRGSIIADSTEKGIERYKKYNPIHRPKVWLLIGTQPLYTAGKNSFMNDIIYTAGGENIAQSITNMAYPVLTREFILSKRPDFLIVSSTQKNTIKQTLLSLYPEMKSLPCLQDTSRVISVEEDILLRPTIRSLRAVEQIHNRILQKGGVSY